LSVAGCQLIPASDADKSSEPARVVSETDNRQLATDNWISP
jgi:hypothetical protein